MSDDPHAFKNLNEMGLRTTRSCPVELDVWRHVKDLSTGQKTGYVKRERMRTAQEVFKDLHKHLDLVRCGQCGHERRRRQSDCCTPHTECGWGEYAWLIDEYFSGPSGPREDFTIPHDYRRVVCFPVTGGSEGHYWHVGILCPHPDGRVPLLYREIALGKTFAGWERCCELANRCANCWARNFPNQETTMKAGRSLQDLAEELERQHRSKKDYMADTRRLALKPLSSGTNNPHEHVLLEGVDGGLSLRPIAHTQLASTLGIPKPVLRPHAHGGAGLALRQRQPLAGETAGQEACSYSG